MLCHVKQAQDARSSVSWLHWISHSNFLFANSLLHNTYSQLFHQTLFYLTTHVRPCLYVICNKASCMWTTCNTDTWFLYNTHIFCLPWLSNNFITLSCTCFVKLYITGQLMSDPIHVCNLWQNLMYVNIVPDCTF